MKKTTQKKQKTPKIESWDYRLIRQHGFLAIHEVYYENNKPVLWTEAPLIINGEDQNDILQEMTLMARACLLPVYEIKKNKLYEDKNK
jgi:hypothetical protein